MGSTAFVIVVETWWWCIELLNYYYNIDIIIIRVSMVTKEGRSAQRGALQDKHVDPVTIRRVDLQLNHPYMDAALRGLLHS